MPGRTHDPARLVMALTAAASYVTLVPLSALALAFSAPHAPDGAWPWWLVVLAGASHAALFAAGVMLFRIALAAVPAYGSLWALPVLRTGRQGPGTVSRQPRAAGRLAASVREPPRARQ